MGLSQKIALRAGLLLSLLTVLWLGTQAMMTNTGPGESPEVQNSAAPNQISKAEQSVNISDGTAMDLDDSSPKDLALLLQPNRADFDQMVKKRKIRVLVSYNQTNFFLDRGRARGIIADLMEQLEKHLNSQLKLDLPRLDIIPIPVNRDQLISFLAEGRGDMAAGNITITAEREAIVDFTNPTSKAVSELVIGGPASPPIASLADLSGQSVVIRKSSSFYPNLRRLSDSLVQAGQAPIEITWVNEALETEDLLELVNSGLAPFTVADSHMVEFWQQVFTGLVVNPDLAIATGQYIGWAVRKDADGLVEVLNGFVAKNKQGTLLGNMLINRYLKSTQYIDNSDSREARERFTQVASLFMKYGEQYNFDHLLLMAQGYQESGLDQSVKSPVGAIGIMQLMPSTAADKSVGIPDVSTPDNNIHAGVRYLNHLREVYFNEPELDPVNTALFCFAAYNAGPTRISRLRRKATSLGLDANKWFGQVEQVVADEVGREPVRYVRNIVKYYTAYKFAESQRQQRETIKSQRTGASASK